MAAPWGGNIPVQPVSAQPVMVALVVIQDWWLDLRNQTNRARRFSLLAFSKSPGSAAALPCHKYSPVKGTTLADQMIWAPVALQPYQLNSLWISNCTNHVIYLVLRSRVKCSRGYCPFIVGMRMLILAEIINEVAPVQDLRMQFPLWSPELTRPLVSRVGDPFTGPVMRRFTPELSVPPSMSKAIHWFGRYITYI